MSTHLDCSGQAVGLGELGLELVGYPDAYLPVDDGSCGLEGLRPLLHPGLLNFYLKKKRKKR